MVKKSIILFQNISLVTYSGFRNYLLISRIIFFQLVAFSEYHLRQLTKHSQTYVDVSVSEEDRYVDIVGNVYCPKVPITCDAYERYSDGLKESLKLLGDLKTYEQFFLFLNNPEPCGNQPSIDDFLQRPSEHLEAVMLTLRTILSHTPNDHKDAEALRLVVEGMYCTSSVKNSVAPLCLMNSYFSYFHNHVVFIMNPMEYNSYYKVC